MARIKRATRSGQPGFVTRSVEGFTGNRVSGDRETKSSVRRLFARNPAKNQTDITNFTNHARVPNPNAAPSPQIINGSQVKRTSVTGRFSIRNRSLNSRITRR